jgi:hypothetical protein
MFRYDDYPGNITNITDDSAIPSMQISPIYHLLPNNTNSTPSKCPQKDKMASEGPITTDPFEGYQAVRDGSLEYAMYRYCPDSDSIVLRETGLYDPDAGSESAWQVFLDRLQEDECRYVVYDFEYTGVQDGKEVPKRKLLYILWWVWFSW